MAAPMRYAATAVFMLCVVASGILHGRQTFRWIPKPPIDQYANRIDDIPKSFDDWTSEEVPILDDLRAHGIEKYIYRNYRSRRSTDSYRVLVVCGRFGPIAAHTPDVCYRGSGYTAVGDQRRGDVTVTGDDATKSRVIPLHFMRFKPPATRADAFELEIRWAWMPPGKGFKAPDSPRIEFYSEPALYKVYIVSERPSVASTVPGSSSVASSLAPAPTATQHDPTKFLQSFLPRLEAALKDPTPAK